MNRCTCCDSWWRQENVSKKVDGQKDWMCSTTVTSVVVSPVIAVLVELP